MFKRRYRIVTDQYSGFEVQFKLWWWPFWLEAGTWRFWGSNTWATLEQARQHAKLHSEGKIPHPSPRSRVVEELP